MPLYFFHLNFGHRVLPDEEGVELPNRSAARLQRTAQLLEHNRALRDELSSLCLVSEVLRVRSRRLVAQARLAACHRTTLKLSASQTTWRSALSPFTKGFSAGRLRPGGRPRIQSWDLICGLADAWRCGGLRAARWCAERLSKKGPASGGGA